MADDQKRNSSEVRVLIVDEHETYCKQLSELAEFVGRSVKVACEHARSGAEALEMMESWQPSIVLVDAYIPDMNCFDLVHHCLQGLFPVIVASENPSHEIETSAYERGASGYVIKSEDPDELEMLLMEIASFSEADSYTH